MRRRTIEPLVSSFCAGVAKTVRESGSSTFYLSEGTFDAVGISTFFRAEIEAVPIAGVFQRGRAVTAKSSASNTAPRNDPAAARVRAVAETGERRRRSW